MTEIGKPGIDIDDVSVTDISLSEIGLLVTIVLENNNPIAIPMEDIDFDIYGTIGGNERRVAHGHHGEYSMPPGKSTMSIPVVMKNSEIMGALSDFMSERSVALRITGTARIGRSFLSYPVHFSEERRFRL